MRAILTTLLETDTLPRDATGDALVRIEGPQSKLLTLEHVGLNLLQRMYGIATVTQRLLERASQRCPATRITGTRKTPWGPPR